MHDMSGRDRGPTRITLDEDGERTFAEIDSAAIAEYNKKLEEQKLREKKLLRQYDWRDSKLPPFSIEPMPHERQRLSGAGMTAEDRALRRQWLKDQELSPNEPVFVPDLVQRNPIRRFYSAPWNALFNRLRPYLPAQSAATARYLTPKIATFIAGVYILHYYFKYNLGTWDEKYGWRVISSRPVLLHADKPPEFVHNDQGFRDRKALLDMKTSTPVTN